MGIYATRTPHRFNPIGLSIAKLDSVDLKKKTLNLSGVDLIDGTPVLDIKPYHYVDALSPETMRIPEWLEQTKDKDLLGVSFSQLALEDLKTFVDEDRLRFFKE